MLSAASFDRGQLSQLCKAATSTASAPEAPAHSPGQQMLAAAFLRVKDLGSGERGLTRLLIGLLLGVGLSIASVHALWWHGASRRLSALVDRHKALAARFEQQERLMRLIADNQPSAIFLVGNENRGQFAIRSMWPRSTKPRLIVIFSLSPPFGLNACTLSAIPSPSFDHPNRWSMAPEDRLLKDSRLVTAARGPVAQTPGLNGGYWACCADRLPLGWMRIAG